MSKIHHLQSYLLPALHRHQPRLCVVRNRYGTVHLKRRPFRITDSVYLSSSLAAPPIRRFGKPTFSRVNFPRISISVCIVCVFWLWILTLCVYLGTTHVITPRDFVDDLKVLEIGGAGSKAIPNGLRDMRGEPKSFQQLYDERYFTKDAPRPQPPQPIPQKKLAPPRVQAPPAQTSPSSSYQGSINSGMVPGKEEKDKKKKKGFFKGW